MQFEGFITTWTDAACLFHAHWWSEHDFIPKSQIEEVIKDPETNEVTLVISSWIAGKKELKEFEYRETENA